MLQNEKFFREVGLRPAIDPPCFYCGQPIRPPWIEWIGHTTITLHPECCMELVIRLVRDLHQHECEDLPDGEFFPREKNPA